MLPGVRVQLTGQDAANVDFTDRLSIVTPIVIAFVLGLAGFTEFTGCASVRETATS